MASSSGGQASFLSLSAELRNYIYNLSGCLKILQCRECHGTMRGDAPEHERVCYYRRLRRDKTAFLCQYRLKAYLWVNRASTARRLEGTKYARINKDCHIRRNPVVGVSQPALTQVSKQVRADTLPMFYGGDHVFMFTALRRTEGLMAAPNWLKMIGEENAAKIMEILVLMPRGVTPERVNRIRSSILSLAEGMGQNAEWTFAEAPVSSPSDRDGFCREKCLVGGGKLEVFGQELGEGKS